IFGAARVSRIAAAHCTSDDFVFAGANCGGRFGGAVVRYMVRRISDAGLSGVCVASGAGSDFGIARNGSGDLLHEGVASFAAGGGGGGSRCAQLRLASEFGGVTRDHWIKDRAAGESRSCGFVWTPRPHTTGDAEYSRTAWRCRTYFEFGAWNSAGHAC